MSAEAPTHVVAVAGDQRSLCGVKDPLPRVAAAHVAAHVEGWGMVVCESCAKQLGRDGAGDEGMLR